MTGPLAVLLLAIVGVSVGLGWWIHPGAGITVGSVLLGGVALLLEEKDPARRRQQAELRRQRREARKQQRQ